MKDKLIAGVAGVLFGAGVVTFLTGCADTTLVQQSGNSLQTSADLIGPMYDLGLQARLEASENPEMMLSEFLARRGVTAITEAEYSVMLDTMNEHKETIDEIKNFGKDEN
tara:strand:- start:118 stop:447 length:330 start_codon:yes stop_codon:yes gene_type:complete